MILLASHASPPHDPAADMEQFGLVSLSEFLDDRFVYRDLQPVDPRYQGYNQCAQQFGLDPAAIPCKTDSVYNKIAVWIVDYMQEQVSDEEVEELLVIGDSRITDGSAFQGMTAYAGWAGSCTLTSAGAAESVAGAAVVSSVGAAEPQATAKANIRTRPGISHFQGFVLRLCLYCMMSSSKHGQ